MKYYFIVVEGVHDIAAISKYLKLQNFQPILLESDLDSFWKKLIPKSFPYNGNLRMRVPVPTFYQSETKSVAIMGSNGTDEIIKTINMLTNIDYELLSGIAIFRDADNEAIDSLLEELNTRIESEIEDEFREKITEIKTSITINDDFRYGVYIFPNNNSQGTLEKLLLEGAELNYAELHLEANKYLNAVSEKNLNYVRGSNFNGSKRDKILVGVIANIMKPGKANQVSIQDNNWLTTESLEFRGQKEFKEFLDEFLE